MTTMIATPADAKRQTRRDVELFVGWVMDRPAELALSPAATAPLLAQILGHDVPTDALLELIVATGVRDRYRGSSAELDAQQKRVDAAVEALLDVRQCEACRTVIDDGTSYVSCNETGFSFCGWDCHHAHHGPCAGGSDRL